MTKNTPRPAAEGAKTMDAKTTGAETQSAPLSDAGYDWRDPLELEGELTEDERMVQASARGYAQDRLFPRVLTAFREERFDREIMTEMGALGLLGPTLPEQYGGAGLGAVAYGPAIRDRTPPLTLDHPPGSLACQVSRCRDSSFAKKSGPEMCDARIYFSVPDFSADVFIASALNSAGGITG